MAEIILPGRKRNESHNVKWGRHGKARMTEAVKPLYGNTDEMPFVRDPAVFRTSDVHYTISATTSRGEVVETVLIAPDSCVKGNRLKKFSDDQAGWGVALLTEGRINGCQNIVAIGDIALFKEGKLPYGRLMAARVAIQQAKHLAENLKKIAKKLSASFHTKIWDRWRRQGSFLR